VLRVRQSKAFGLHTFCILSAYFIKNIYIVMSVKKQVMPLGFDDTSLHNEVLVQNY
jgi:hypothetical protein